MTIDPTRAAFVLQEYRYEEASDPTVAAQFKGARTVEINTQLSTAAAATYAAAYLAATRTQAVVFELEIEGILHLEDFATAPNQYTLNFPRFVTDDRSYKITSARMDYDLNRTLLVIRG